MKNVVSTSDGKFFSLTEPCPEDVSLREIANTLSRIVRFGGRINENYTVAQHCCHVADCLPGHLKIHGLLHDAAEAYIGDIPTPLKKLLPEVAPLEKGIMSAIYSYFGLSLSRSIRKEVKRADTIMLFYEAKHFNISLAKWPVVKGPTNPLKYTWPQHIALSEFLSRFNKYYG